MSLLLLRTMIEFCTKKRMIAAIAFLGSISIIILVIENNWSIGHSGSVKEVNTSPAENQSTECSAEVKVVEECAPCPAFELKSQPYCLQTGYREIVTCKHDGSSKTIHRTCPKLTYLEERDFLLFEAIALCIGLGSYTVVHSRQKLLDKLLFDKVNKQIAAGV